MELDTFPKRLAFAVSLAEDLTPNELDRLTGGSVPHTRLLLTGQRKNPRSRTVERFVRALGLSADWLLFGAGPLPTAEGVGEAVAAARRAARPRGRRGAGARVLRLAGLSP